MFRKLRELFTRTPRPPAPPRPVSVWVEAEEVIVRGDAGEISRFRWDRISSIHAYKQDLLTTDCIWFEFVEDTETGERVHELHEEVWGFKPLLEELPRRFPGMNEGWFGKVAFPAFLPNPTVVWERPAAPPE